MMLCFRFFSLFFFVFVGELDLVFLRTAPVEGKLPGSYLLSGPESRSSGGRLPAPGLFSSQSFPELRNWGYLGDFDDDSSFYMTHLSSPSFWVRALRLFFLDGLGWCNRSFSGGSFWLNDNHYLPAYFGECVGNCRKPLPLEANEEGTTPDWGDYLNAAVRAEEGSQNMTQLGHRSITHSHLHPIYSSHNRKNLVTMVLWAKFCTCCSDVRIIFHVAKVPHQK